MTPKPLKRHKALQPLSREHHHGLLLSWKIRNGFNKNIDPKRMKIYADWFFETHLTPHFEMEENYIFSILESDNELIKRALAEHRRLRRLFSETEANPKTLSKIEEELEQHIRFEERVLFPEIQKVASEEQLLHIEKIHQPESFKDNLEDEFWK
ncbi:MAG: cation-binding protein [Xanthomarina sp.]|jgi:hemerythrin-like domain-containing protein|uniref:Cation-binding protein n=1 Tax=Xanthomarina gelatinilytica TaxID=1137281 RepID=A0A3D6BRF4_9FLAO|nr:hemerythrin domain-containing protein [Xanthomarina sp.]MAL22905.1 cation-binding protein [Xanthomarina sp.]MBF62759.1 cation-binding protein [Xanthomarina sp.]HAB28082.1 cation-binding protein [Xanthomarina gelatinilytica]HCY80625.1 cation-binding protein [Xanthomarina gelatinilytica]|tara:strand:- start:113 stop:574 length:462 start_codon:yes stop_codon:yes gene_type:complete